MAKPSKWFNNIIRRCRYRHNRNNTVPTVTSDTPSNSYYGGGDAVESNKHAIAVAAATAAVAEAALAAARAAAEVVRLTSNVGGYSSEGFSRRWSFQDFAAVKIQSAFRGYLARKALKALKGLVKLQALVRGHFVRKQSAEMLRRLQAMVRVQARARSCRVLCIESSHCSPGKENPRTPEIYASSSEKLEESPVVKSCGSNSSIRDSKWGEKAISAPHWLDNWVENPRSDDEKNDKILEIDSWKPSPKAKPKPSRHISAQDYYNHSFAASDYLARYSPNDVFKPNVGSFAEDEASLKSLRFPLEAYTTPQSNSPQTFSGASRSGSMRKSPKTPSRDECSKSYINGFATFASPSYMGNTQSSRARSRSVSVPRQRGNESEKLSSIKRSLHAYWESKTSSKKSLDSSSNLSKQRW